MSRARRDEPWTPESRWRDGARDDETRAAHAADTRERRRARAVAELDAVADRLLKTLRETGDLEEAAETAGTTAAAVRGRMRWDAAWAQRVDDVLDETCPAGEHCGTPSGPRWHRGHCRACREAKRGPAAAATSPRVCVAPGCGRELPAGSRAQRRTCSAACRTAMSPALDRRRKA